jgi:flavin-dependent dehydrogenase
LPSAMKARPCTSTRAMWNSELIVDRPSMTRTWGNDWFVDRAVFDDELRSEAMGAGATFQPAVVVSVSRQDASWRVRLQNKAEYHARLLVDATGRASGIGKKLGARRVRLDSLVGTPISLNSRSSSANSTMVASASTGWWYLGPHSNGEEAGAIFFTDSDLPSYRRLRRSKKLCEFAPSNAAIELAGARISGKPLAASSGWLRPCTGDGWLAVGDAAATFDPLSSDGLRHALHGAEMAADAISKPNGFNQYEAAMRIETLAYLADRTAVYGSEKRWQEQPFWSRRASDAAHI